MKSLQSISCKNVISKNELNDIKGGGSYDSPGGTAPWDMGDSSDPWNKRKRPSGINTADMVTPSFLHF